MPNLIALPPNTNLIEDPFYLSKKVIIQDKSSCFPAMILSPPSGASCIDACAAPGNKTQHLSCLLKNTGHIIAFDLDSRRLETLTEQMALVHFILLFFPFQISKQRSLTRKSCRRRQQMLKRDIKAF